MAEKKRCAIYTRKSTEEGLEQAFNSLDAQREACAAYILSQAHEGWEALPDHYDDGGWSGGSMERPALRQLLADVEAGKADIIVVYKVDRLTRSLADFARIVDTLDKAGASFVSVTQAFNTTNSMGRLTLNVLLSFAQFEREVTGERIRDKIAASKQKGMWMGGPVPIGYDLADRKLVINDSEAQAVRLMFDRYEKLRSLAALAEELDGLGIRTKLRLYRDGRIVGGIAFTRGPLAQLLQNPIYMGKVRHKGVLHEGQHEAIILEEQWQRVQAIFADNGRDRKLGRKARHPSLLAGILNDPDGRPMTPVHTRKGARRYRYYVTRNVVPKEQWRLPAGEVEELVITAAATLIRSEVPHNDDATALDIATERDQRDALAEALPTMNSIEQRATLLDHGIGVQIDEKRVTVTMGGVHDTIDAELVRRGSELRLAIAPSDDRRSASVEPVLLRLVTHAMAAQDMILTDRHHPCVADYGKRHLWQLLRISWLAPDIISAILDGAQPAPLTGRRLLRATSIPLDWAGQRAFLGFA